MDAQQLEFARAHGTRLPEPVTAREIAAFVRSGGRVTKCPPSPLRLGFGILDWGVGRDAEAQYRSQHLRRHGDPVRRHYWQLARHVSPKSWVRSPRSEALASDSGPGTSDAVLADLGLWTSDLGAEADG